MGMAVGEDGTVPSKSRGRCPQRRQATYRRCAGKLERSAKKRQGLRVRLCPSVKPCRSNCGLELLRGATKKPGGFAGDRARFVAKFSSWPVFCFRWPVAPSWDHRSADTSEGFGI